ncbi:hypothetical protein ACJMK2_018718 [Sinanodonta woodiana]|uniref:Uncharacterized protein n=1 Tax=Sinanodonta woodiana TaxID=1069815 RepID=A0ABD3UFX9_SINWO
MENKIDTFNEPDKEPIDDANDIEDECSMIRESDDSSYKPDESDPMDSSFNSVISKTKSNIDCVTSYEFITGLIVQSNFSEEPSTNLMSERKFIAFEVQLLSLFLTCHYCHGPAKGKVTNNFGIIVTQE